MSDEDRRDEEPEDLALAETLPKGLNLGGRSRPQRHRLLVRTEPSIEVPEEVRVEAALRPDNLEWVDPLEETQRLEQVPSAEDRAGESRLVVRTIRTHSPMIQPADERGRSIVELPDEVSGVVERGGTRGFVEEAAEHGAAFGVLVRQIHVIE